MKCNWHLSNFLTQYTVALTQGSFGGFFFHPSENHVYLIRVHLELIVKLLLFHGRSVSPLQAETNIPKCGLTANTTTDFLFCSSNLSRLFGLLKVLPFYARSVTLANGGFYQ